MKNWLVDDSWRPWPLPHRPWIMKQTWHDLLFAHWPIPVDSLRDLIPPQLTLQTFGGSAWLGVVPFRMSGVGLRGMPNVPGLSAFPELNVRTYVVADEKPGIWFFSLDAANPLAVAVARRWFHLPYFNARMTCTDDGKTISYRSGRSHGNASAVEFIARYQDRGEVFRSTTASIEQWLTERYCLYSADTRGRIYRGEVHHAPWPLQLADAEIELNTMTLPINVTLGNLSPMLHFARKLSVVVWSLERLT